MGGQLGGKPVPLQRIELQRQHRGGIGIEPQPAGVVVAKWNIDGIIAIIFAIGGSNRQRNPDNLPPWGSNAAVPSPDQSRRGAVSKSKATTGAAAR